LTTSSLTGQVLTALSDYASHTRLYALKFDDERASRALSARDVIALSTRAAIPHAALLGQQASLEISLADGTRVHFGGYLSEVATLASAGGLTRYRLRLSTAEFNASPDDAAQEMWDHSLQ
jgi:uncharacterized protein involved in type VI secretion and phage assembly